jgi:hypothetical protein
MYKVDKLYLKEYWDIPVEYHPTTSGRIIINIPGAGGSVKGYMNKYLNLGDHIQDKGFASFVRVPNDRPQEFLNTGRSVVNYCLEHSKEICDNDTPELWLMGFSAGGASAILTAWEYPEITKVLAINPFIETVRDDVRRYLPEYKGELYLVTGENDKVIGSDTVEYIMKFASNVSELQTYVIPNCDHQLKGDDNARILSQLPEYYFLEGYKTKNFPDSTHGYNLLSSFI